MCLLNMWSTQQNFTLENQLYQSFIIRYKCTEFGKKIFLKIIYPAYS